MLSKYRILLGNFYLLSHDIIFFYYLSISLRLIIFFFISPTHFILSYKFLTRCIVLRVSVLRRLIKIYGTYMLVLWARYLSRYSDSLLAGKSEIEFRWGRNFPPVQTGPGVHPVSCEMGTESFPEVKCGQGVLLTIHPLLAPRSWKSRAIPLSTLWATLYPRERPATHFTGG